MAAILRPRWMARDGIVALAPCAVKWTMFPRSWRLSRGGRQWTNWGDVHAARGLPWPLATHLRQPRRQEYYRSIAGGLSGLRVPCQVGLVSSRRVAAIPVSTSPLRDAPTSSL
eukprot:5652151-Amphidinium_carterae.2